MILRALILVALFIAAPVSADMVKMDTNVLVILDSSGSMWGLIDGKSKAESSHEILNKVLGDLPQDAKLGLLTFGHRHKGDCSDIELLSPIGSENSAAILKKVNNIKPKGITPLTDALLQAREAFKGTAGAKMIILITDGGEECKGDPCAATRQLALDGLVVRVNVVGFDLGEKERKQLECVAREGTGRYFSVKDKETLYAAVGEVKKEVIEYKAPPPVVKPPEPVTPPLPAVVRPEPVVPKQAEGVNLFAPAQGGQFVVMPNASWPNIVSTNNRLNLWARAGQEAVFAFKDGKPATFYKFSIEIPFSQPQNIQQFELLISDESPDGPFNSIGRFTVRNQLRDPAYQEFTFTPISAKYIKFRIISNYGYEMHGWGDTQLYQIRLMGSAN